MKKLFAVLAAVGLLLGFAATASAKPSEDNGPGPNGKNDHGLCTAYFNGQKVGHGDGENPENNPPPFDGLEETGNNYTDNDGVDNDFDGDIDEPDEAADPPDQSEDEHTSLTQAENIWNYCENSGVESLIGGNPEHGRFTCFNQENADDPDTDEVEPIALGDDDPSSPECGRNEKPGNG
jgi:hypothetical protein